MRILHVVSGIDARLGGPVAALTGLVRAQAALGHEPIIAASYCKGHDLSIAEQLRHEGIKVDLIGPALIPKLAWHPSIRRHLDALLHTGIDVVHIHALWEEIQHRAARLAARHHIPYIIRPCGMLDPWSLRQGAAFKKIYMAARLRKNLTQASAIHYTTAAERDLAAPLRILATPIVEPNGLDLSEFGELPPKGLFRERFPQVGHRPYALFLSRLHFKKGLDLLIPAFQKAALKDVDLVIAGPADSAAFEDELKALVRQQGMEQRVHFVGMLRGVQKIAALAEAQLFVLPSRQENFGVSVIEALAAGTPVLVSDQVNLHDVVSEREVGGVVPLDIDRLTAELRRWLENPVLCRATGERARPFALETYAWPQIARRWTAHYQELRARRETG